MAVVLVGFELLARAGFLDVESINLTPIPREIVERTGLPGLSFRLRPGSRGIHRLPGASRDADDPGGSVTYTINALGFRGPETTLAKPSGVVRVVALGDSFTFGAGVPDDSTWPAALGRELGPASEVLNLGVMAYDTSDEVALLEAQGLALEPDLVVVAFHVNDAGGGGQLQALGDARRAGLPAWRRASRLLDVLAYRLEIRAAGEAVLDSYRRSFAADSPGWSRVRSALRRLSELGERDGFEVVLALYPLLWDPLHPYPLGDVHGTVADFARGLGLRVVDLTPAFAGEQAPALWVHPADHHPNARAQAIAAHALGSFLRDEKLVPGAA